MLHSPIEANTCDLGILSCAQVGPSMINRSWGHVRHIAATPCRLLLAHPPQPSILQI